MTTDIPPTGGLLVTSIFLGEVSSRACSGAFTCCTGMAQSQGQHTLWGNRILLSHVSLLLLCDDCCTGCCMTIALQWDAVITAVLAHGLCQATQVLARGTKEIWQLAYLVVPSDNQCQASQRSLHNAPIFRLLLKVAVNGTHQCDLSNFCGAAKLQQKS